jgi:hypothetical protein
MSAQAGQKIRDTIDGLRSQASDLLSDANTIQDAWASQDWDLLAEWSVITRREAQDLGGGRAAANRRVTRRRRSAR